MGQRLSHVVQNITTRIAAEHLASVSSDAAATAAADADGNSELQDQTAHPSAIALTLQRMNVSMVHSVALGRNLTDRPAGYRGCAQER